MAEHQPLIFSVLDPSPDGQALLTLPGDMGIYRKGAELRFETKVPDEGQVERFSAKVLFTGCSFQLDAQSDLFLQKLLPGAQSSQAFDIGVAWDSEHGVALTGTGGLEITIPLQARLPFLKLHALHLIGRTAAQPGASDFDLELSADFTASLMAIIEVAVERLGLTSKLYVRRPNPAAPCRSWARCRRRSSSRRPLGPGSR